MEFDKTRTYRDKTGDQWWYDGLGWTDGSNSTLQRYDTPPPVYAPYVLEKPDAEFFGYRLA